VHAAIAKEAAREADRPLIPILQAEQIDPLCDRGLKDLREHAARLERLPQAQASDAKLVFLEWNRLQIEMEDLQGPIEILKMALARHVLRTYG
jgi:thimet oligopeptidase